MRGNDQLWGGYGKDTVLFKGRADVRVDLGKTGYQNTGYGKDMIREVENIRSGGGDDRLIGNGKRNTLDGGGGNDALFGKGGKDELHGGTGKDRLKGNAGNDRLYGDGGKDKLFGNDGKDLLEGGHKGDLLRGGSGKDKLFGQNGNDRLFGDSGRDRLDGGTGNDQLTGGRGADTFVFTKGKDLVTDFRASQNDLLTIDTDDLRGVRDMSVGRFLDLYAEDRGNRVVFDFGHGDRLVLNHVKQISDLVDHMQII